MERHRYLVAVATGVDGCAADSDGGQRAYADCGVGNGRRFGCAAAGRMAGQLQRTRCDVVTQCGVCLHGGGADGAGRPQYQGKSSLSCVFGTVACMRRAGVFETPDVELQYDFDADFLCCIRLAGHR